MGKKGKGTREEGKGGEEEGGRREGNGRGNIPHDYFQKLAPMHSALNKLDCISVTSDLMQTITC